MNKREKSLEWSNLEPSLGNSQKSARYQDEHSRHGTR